MNIIIIEDEERAANRLEKLLLEIDPTLIVLAKIESVEESLAFLGTNPQIDVIFSDIQLADGLSFEIYDQVVLDCPIIFTTAYDNYAIQAFETNGVGYILKPIQKEKLVAALDKIAQLKQTQSAAPSIDMVALSQLIKGQEKNYKNRFLVKIGEKVNTVPVEDIITFYSFDKSTFLLTKSGKKYIIDYPLDQLQIKLNPSAFYRINRKYIVSIDACTKMFAHTNSRLKIEIPLLKDHDIIVARERVQDFKSWLDS